MAHEPPTEPDDEYPEPDHLRPHEVGTPGSSHVDDHGLGAARAAGDAAEVARILDRRGVDLIHTQYADWVREAVSTLPLDVCEGFPGMGHRLEDTGRLPLGTTPVDLPGTREEAEAEFARNGDLKLRYALAAIVARRRRGLTDQALAIAVAGTPLAEASAYPWYGSNGRLLPFWYLQAGVTAFAAGALDTAEHFYRSAWTHRSRDPYGFVARDTAGKLAISSAFVGDHTASVQWLERAQAANRVPGMWVDGMVEESLSGAAAIQAIDALSPDAEALLSKTSHPGQRREHWPVVLWLFVEQALTHGDTARAWACLVGALEPRPVGLVENGLAACLVPMVRAQIQLAMGHADDALAELDRAPEQLADSRVLRARILLLSGRAAAALEVLDAMDADSRIGPRARTEALLVAACGHLAIGGRRSAVLAASKAAVKATEQQAPRSLATVPRTFLNQLVPEVPALAPLLAVLDERGVTDIYPASGQRVSLTEREHKLLLDLTSGQTLKEIAETRYVSVNTIRTHLANLRRKLDASSRKEVLSKARLLGLLDRPG